VNSSSTHSRVGRGVGAWQKIIFRDGRVQALVSRLLSGDLNVIRPVFDLKYGVKYPDVEQIIGESTR